MGKSCTKGTPLDNQWRARTDDLQRLTSPREWVP